MKLDLSSLFNEELLELEKAEAICSSEEYKSDKLYPAFERLTSTYGKSIKSMMKLMKISDSQQAHLQQIKDELGREIKERKRIEEKLEYYAFTDSMTGIPNRRTGLIQLEKELDSSAISKKPVSICFLDIDGLKDVNDVYGHNEGDYLINTVSRLIKDSLRDVDSVSRMGGDEFLIVFPDCRMEGAYEAISRIQMKMKQHDETSGKPYNLHFSYGIEEVNGYNNIQLDELIKTADKKMYMNKVLRKRTSKKTD